MHLNGLEVVGQDSKAIKNHRLNQIFGYDSLGNIKSDKEHQYYYGLDGNMQSITGVQNGEFEYDHNNNRIYQDTKTLKNSNKTVNFYSKAGMMLYEYDVNNQRATKYLHLGNNKIVKISTTGKTGAASTSYLYNDALGSPVAEIDSSGKTLWREAYLPFGARLINDAKLNKYWFIGKEQDTSGLSYFGARYYNPITARFMAPDPMKVDPENPFSFNRYAYGNNNPYKYVDPDGRAPADPGTMGMEFLLGGLIGGVGGYLETKTWDGAVVGFGFGGATAVISSPFASRAAGVGAAAEYTIMKRAGFKVADIAINATGSTLSSYVNTKQLDVANGGRGTIFAATAHAWSKRGIPKNTELTALGTFAYSKYASVLSIIPDLISYHDKNNNLKVDNKSHISESQNKSSSLWGW